MIDNSVLQIARLFGTRSRAPPCTPQCALQQSQYFSGVTIIDLMYQADEH